MSNRVKIAILACLALLGLGLGWFGRDALSALTSLMRTGEVRPIPMTALEGAVSDWGRDYPAAMQSVVSTQFAALTATAYDGADYDFVSTLTESVQDRQDLSGVGRIDFLDASKNAVAYCTGAAISETHVITAGHCFYKDGRFRAYSKAIFKLGLLWPENTKDKPRPIEIELDIPASAADATSAENAARWIVRYPEDRDPDLYTLDYAILPFKDAGAWAAAAAQGRRPVRLAVARLTKGDELFMGHHAKAWVQVRSECTVSGKPDKPQFAHTCDTHPGSSGGPVFSRAYRAVVGLHVCCDLIGSNERTGRNFAVNVADIVKDSPLLAGRMVDLQPVTAEERQALDFLEQRRLQAVAAFERGNNRLALKLLMDGFQRFPEKAEDFERLLHNAPLAETQLQLTASELNEVAAFQHDSMPVGVEFMQDGEHVLSWSVNGEIAYWSAKTGRATYTKQINGFLSDLALSPDQSRAIARTDEAKVLVWKVSTGEMLADWENDGQFGINRVALRPGSDEVFLHDGTSELHIRRIDAGQLKPVFKFPVEVWNFDVNSRGDRALLSDASGSFELWNLETRMRVENWPPREGAGVTSFEFSPHADVFGVGFNDGTISFHSARDGKTLFTQKEGGAVVDFLFSSDGGSFLSRFSGLMPKHYRRRMSDGAVAATYAFDRDVPAPDFAGKPGHVATSVGPRVKVWTEDYDDPIWEFESELSSFDLFASPESSLLVAANSDGAEIYSISASARLARVSTGGPVRAAFFAPDGASAALIVDNGSVHILRFEDAYNKLLEASVTGEILDIDAFGGGAVLYRVPGLDVRQAKVSVSGKETTGPTHKNYVNGGAFWPEKDLAITWDASEIIAWKASTGEIVSRHAQIDVAGVRLDPEGKRAVSWSYYNSYEQKGVAHVWKLSDGKASLPDLVSDLSVVSAAFTPQGVRYVLDNDVGQDFVEGEELSAWVLDQPGKGERREIKIPRVQLMTVTLSPDGARLVAQGLRRSNADIVELHTGDAHSLVFDAVSTVDALGSVLSWAPEADAFLRESFSDFDGHTQINMHSLRSAQMRARLPYLGSMYGAGLSADGLQALLWTESGGVYAANLPKRGRALVDDMRARAAALPALAAECRDFSLSSPECEP